jgi:hypothetical protein
VSESFADKLGRIQPERGSNLALRIAPRLPRLPLPVQRYDDPFLPFGKAVIQATRDLVCAYVFDFPAYLAIGAAGAIALERTIAYAGRDVITVLDGSFGTPDYLMLMDETAFNADAITTINSDFPIVRTDRAVFLVGNSEDNRVGTLVYDKPKGLLILQDTCLRVVGEDVLYISAGNDFEERIRAELVRQQNA